MILECANCGIEMVWPVLDLVVFWRKEILRMVAVFKYSDK